ncbi:Elongation of very long chain fatty acids protein [Temnothorax longispinosus]|uniref:Elongation of very long chain fatty acids protein n=1 Tax=Temnothorax longispinosus TaxID=300112 RepID=A0A4S2JWE6_9HYME|nr:Elongation of very long chain fatty acids protein [Temnothorax longispinosus]
MREWCSSYYKRRDRDNHMTVRARRYRTIGSDRHVRQLCNIRKRIVYNCPSWISYMTYIVTGRNSSLTRCAWYFFLLKIFDYVETIVFVLRKKDNQISGLHLYHHVSTLLLSWAGIRFYAVAPMVLTCIINCFIHTIMYTYYFLAAWGSNVQKAVTPLKRWITIAQMIQFVVLILYASQKYVLKDCEIVNNYVIALFVGNVVINFFMFHNFYQKTYKEVKKVQSTSSRSTASQFFLSNTTCNIWIFVLRAWLWASVHEEQAAILINDVHEVVQYRPNISKFN